MARTQKAAAVLLLLLLPGCATPPPEEDPAVFPKTFLALMKNTGADETLAQNRAWIWINFTNAEGVVLREARVLDAGEADWAQFSIPHNGTYHIEVKVRSRAGGGGGSGEVPLAFCARQSALWMNVTVKPNNPFLGASGLGTGWDIDC